MQFLAMVLLALAAVTAMTTALPLEDDNKQDYIIVGDMRFPKESTTSTTRGIKVDRKWPEGIVPYVISSSYTAADRNIILNAFKELSDLTCVQFLPWTNQATYLDIFPGSGCWSHVGWQADKKSLPMSLGSPCCMNHRMVIHEVMHVLGFIHEQNREDRDYSVIVNLDNAGAEENELMKSYDTVSLGIPYNVESVMQYNPLDFSNNGKPVLVSARPHHPINTDKVPFSDFRRINRLYNCWAYKELLLDIQEFGDIDDDITVAPV